jgi:hypothetical protein
MIATSRFGPAIVFKLVTTFREYGEMPTSFVRLVDVVSRNELVDIGVVKTTFVALL